MVTKAIENRRMRMLPVDEVTFDLLKKYLGENSFSGENNKIFRINLHRAWQIIRDCADRADLPKLINPATGKMHNVSPHKLRDAFAVHAMKTEWKPLQLLSQHP
jgi:integrase/recombinase XerD